MPKKTFLNLSKEKKVNFIKNALIEFSEHPLHEASINRIVKSCNIARGSFYQYFNDIYDLYNYILELSRQQLDDTFLKSLKKTKDLRKTFINSYDAIVKYGTKKENIKYFENIFRNTTIASLKEKYLKTNKELIGSIISYIDKEKINTVGKEEFLFIIELLYIEIINSSIDVFIYKKEKKIIRENYIKRIGFITKNMYET